MYGIDALDNVTQLGTWLNGFQQKRTNPRKNTSYRDYPDCFRGEKKIVCCGQSYLLDLESTNQAEQVLAAALLEKSQTSSFSI